MTRVEWDRIEERFYQHGVDRGVLYPTGGMAVAWNGLVSVTDQIGRDVKSWYQDGVKFFEHAVIKPYSGKIEAITYPDILDLLLGGQKVNGVLFHEQPVGQFGLCYRSLVGGQIQGPEMAYRLHFLYNLTATADDQDHTTIGDRVAPSSFGFSISGTPIAVQGMKPTCHISVDSRSVSPTKLQEIEAMAYGTAGSDPYLPSPAELVA